MSDLVHVAIGFAFLAAWFVIGHRLELAFGRNPLYEHARRERRQRRIAKKLCSRGLGRLVRNEPSGSRLELELPKREATLMPQLTPETLQLSIPIVSPALVPAGAIVEPRSLRARTETRFAVTSDRRPSRISIGSSSSCRTTR